MTDYAGKLALERNEWIEECQRLRARIVVLEGHRKQWRRIACHFLDALQLAKLGLGQGIPQDEICGAIDRAVATELPEENS